MKVIPYKKLSIFRMLPDARPEPNCPQGKKPTYNDATLAGSARPGRLPASLNFAPPRCRIPTAH
jgi:hypothetical protein